MKIRRIDFSPDEWIAGTVDLSNEERGMYITACALIYSRDGPIETEALRAACPGDFRPFKRILERLVSLGKIQRSGSQLSQKRCLSELELCRKRSLTSAENGRKGGRPSKENNDVENPGLSASRARAPSTINHQPSEEDSEATPLRPVDPTKEVFDRGVAMLGKARRSLLGKFCKQHGEVAVLEALVATEDANTVDPVSYFIACMSRAPPKNGVNGKHPGTYRPGPGAALFEGGYNAAESYIRKHGLGEAGSEFGDAPSQPLLDRK